METLVSFFLTFCAGVVALPVIVFCFEIIAALVLGRGQSTVPVSSRARIRVAVLVPAHNESMALLPALADVRKQLLPRDRLIVVADNCTDDTALLASAAGAEVLERHDSAHRGKGYALDFGLRHLSSDPPDIVIIVDADCRLSERTIEYLTGTCAITNRPVQALDLMIAPDHSAINHRVAEFAWRVKNWLRPLGLRAMGLPCQLMGTGMALPWDLIRSTNLAEESIVEDLKLGLDLTLAGHPPLFCPSARVTSAFPSSAAGAESQRRRWEQGHINLILKVVPRFLYLGIARRNWALLALTLDLAVPPLSLLAMLTVAMFAVTAVTAFLGFPAAAMAVSTATSLAFLSAVFLAWLNCGRDVLPPRAIWSIAPYVLGKLPLYRRILSNKTETRWIRTDRTKSG
jgi:cellulose synthase/poly-beta-1,6-N-acetylglucosamine synthase-like glycosyltransferase